MSQHEVKRKFMIALSEDDIRECSSRALCRHISARLKCIRAAYIAALKKTNTSKSEEWLCDNFHLIEKEGRTVIQELKGLILPCDNRTSQKLPLLFQSCVNLLMEDKTLPDDQTLNGLISEYQKRRMLTLSELSHFSQLLRAALVEVAYWGSQESGDTAENLLACAVKGFRNLDNIDFDLLLEQHSEAVRMLRQDPAGAFIQMDKASRHLYLHKLSEYAKKHGMEELFAARDILNKAKNATEERKRHIGYYLLDETQHKTRGHIFIIAEWVVAHIFALLLAFWAGQPWLALLMIFPIWEGLRAPVEAASLYHVSPIPLPRMETGGVVPENAPTLITVSTLLPPAAKAGKLKERLKRLYYTNPDGAVSYCILADLKGAKSPTLPEDATDIAASRRIVAELNTEFGDRFYLIVRNRTYSQTEEEYTGYERKRGAIDQLVSYIKGEEIDFLCLEGNTEKLKQMKYLLALDSDTGILINSAAEMVGAALHPLNKPVLSPSGNRVEQGYGILAPRVEVDLMSSNATPFAKIMAGSGGVASYENTVSERYQDLFGEGIFAGKGLIDVDAFHTVMKDRLPEGRVLSHDILEGGFLRTAYMSDIQMTDGFPAKENSFHSRLHRWIRGDWQNIRYLGPHYKVKGTEIKNELKYLSKYKLFDNLRRAVTPVLSALLLIVAFFLPHRSATILAAAALLSNVGSELFSGARALISGGIDMLSRRYYSRTFPAAMSSLIRAVFNFTLLPLTAFLSLDAILRALYRQIISGKRLLQWRTAAESEEDSHKFRGFLLHYLPSILLGGFLLFARQANLLRLIGILFLVSLPLGMLSARLYRPRKISLEKVSREKLISYAAAMWRYYDEFCGKEDHYLPPDNIQQTPVYRVAHRTSPTNIGLMLLSTLAARDFGFIDSAGLCKRLEQTLDSVEKLETYRGNLLNWYDTRTLQSLNPRVVSTVDSGNFICCLVALRQGLKEYTDECRGLDAVCLRLERLEKSCDLSLTYDKRRKLFHIAYDVDQGALSPSFYDLLMSESRMTGYYSIATRQIPKSHWGMLGRTLVRHGGYTGCVSWTGTMFEYFMPYLLLPAYEGSLSYEALKFCIYCQKQRVRKRSIPWGISESGFYAFDSQLNYQYKAHGVQKLGLKRGLDKELVISPYSTFLTLPLAPRSALENLERLEKMKLSGYCGFYEAADFTRRRIAGQDYAVIRSYMTHHVGMSFLAVCNAVTECRMQKRFMKDERMAAASELLEEKIPIGAVVFEDADMKEIPNRPQRLQETSGEVTNPNPAFPQMHLLTNGEWTLAASDSGSSISLYRGLDITRRSDDLLRRAQGIFGVLYTEGETLPITYAPVFDSGYQYSVKFGKTSTQWKAVGERLEGSMTAYVHPHSPAEQRTFTLKNRTKNTIEATLFLYLEPCLAPYRDDAAHPMFSKMFLQSSYYRDNKVLIFTRKCRYGDEPMSLAMGFSKNMDFSFDTARDKLLIRPLSLEGLDLSAQKELHYSGYSPDPCAAFQVKITIPPHMSREIQFVMCAAPTRQEALELLLSIREEQEISSSQAASIPFRSDTLESRLTSELLPKLFYPTYDCEEIQNARRERHDSLHQLWSLGISGDYPLVLLDIDSQESLSLVQPYIRIHRRLTISGVPFDLVFLTKENTGVQELIQRFLTEESCESALGERAGIHLINNSRLGENTLPLLLSAASSYISASKKIEKQSERFLPAELLPVEAASDAPNGFTEDGKYVMNHPTPSPFCIVLANPTFGTLVSNQALGCTWAINSRENKLTPWFNDVASDNRGEMLLAKVDGKIYDLCYGASCEFSSQSAKYSGHFEDIFYTVTVHVPSRGMQKKVEVTFQGSRERKIEVAYYTEPLLSADRKYVRHLKGEWEDDLLLLQNEWSRPAKGYLYLSGGTGCNYCCNRSEFLSGNWNSRILPPLEDPCAAIINEINIHIKNKASVTFLLGFAAHKKAAFYLKKHKPLETVYQKNSITVHTPDRELNQLVNHWLPLQIFGSRIFGRIGFYQSGGAYGFRDQLQDVSSIISLAPEVAKRQIFRAAAAQFPEGDVMHWWHVLPRSGGGIKGVRTRYSDDLLWLPYTVCEYVQKTGDYDILKTEIYYAQGEELQQDEKEKYFTPMRSSKKDTLYQHCINSIKRAVRLGTHNLPLIGGGDWNDGFNLIGTEGKGESVWLAQFLAIVLQKMAPLSNPDTAEQFKAQRKALLKAVDTYAWDGEWYARAFFDNGESIGTLQSVENKIDSLTQSFSVLADMPNLDRRRSALDSAMAKLVDKSKGVIRLFSPAFTGQGQNPGYVSAYPEGMRENGGQYTHAAVWLAMAMLREERIEEGYQLIQMLNPAKKYMDKSLQNIYLREPFALCGDISYHPDIMGRGGWSLYTGAAGWYYRVIVEELLGIKIFGDKVYVQPRIPKSWDGFDATIIHNQKRFEIKVKDGKVKIEEPTA